MSSSAVRWIGICLVTLSTLGFVLAGLGFLGISGLYAIWQTLAVISALISLLLLVIFWHRWLLIGVLIDAGILVWLLWTEWPPVAMIGP